MKIDKISQIFNENINKDSLKNSTNYIFNDILDFNLKLEKEKEEISNEIEQFKSDLRKYGPYSFLNQLNESKIEEKIARKKAELIQNMGLNDENLQKNERAELQNLLEKILSEYKKELLSSTNNNLLLERANQINNSKNSTIMLASLLLQLR